MAKKQPEKQKRRTIRLLPMTVTMLSLLFIIKVNELYIGSERLRDMVGVRDASAEEKKPAEKKDSKESDKKEDKKDEKSAEHAKDADKPKEGEHGDAKKEDAGHEKDKKEEESAEHGKEADKPKEGEHGDAKKEDAGHGDEKKEEGGHGGGDKPVEEERTHGTGKSTVKEIEAMKARDAQPRFSKTELDLLQNLTKRREELEQRERDLDMKSRVLDATDKRINDKISEMKVLQTDLTKVLAQYNEKQDAQIKSLVKIYEGMKPDEAAKIFDELEMPILLEVIGKMSERKVALVLANMNPKRARDVTQELAEKRKKAAMGGGAAAKP